MMHLATPKAIVLKHNEFMDESLQALEALFQQ